MDELAHILEPFTPIRRTAILFALETRSTLAETVLLDWKTANRLAKTDLAKELLRVQPRHIRLDYCFWEWLDGERVAAPLFGLDKSLDDFGHLQQRYDHLILIDQEAERIAFLQDVKAVVQQG